MSLTLEWGEEIDCSCVCVAKAVFFYHYKYCHCYGGHVSKSPSDGNFFGLLLV